MQKSQLLAVNGKFLWSFGKEFFIETKIGNFVWCSPDYGDGDNSVRQFQGSYSDWLDQKGLDFARDKGTHSILYYIGEDFTFEETK